MPLEDFEILEELGKGSFGCVARCVRRSDMQVYAMKQIKLQKLKEKDKKNALNEIRFLASIENQYIVSYKEAFYDEPTEKLCIVMECANEGDLQQKIKKHNVAKTKFTQAEIWRVGFHVLEGLSALHDANIIHRDIKPANIFFSNGIAKIGDLNVAKHLKDQFTATQTGTPYYASPEVWNEEPYNFKSDIWSIGCVLYEMCTGRPPFRAETPEKLFRKIISGQYERLSAPFSRELSNFIARMMSQDQRKRPSAKQLLAEPMLLELRNREATFQQEDERLIKTIKFPANLRNLNENLPKPKYSQGKSMKTIENKEPAVTPLKKSMIPTLRSVISDKNLHTPAKSSIHSKMLSPPSGITSSAMLSPSGRSKKVLSKIGSTKLLM